MSNEIKVVLSDVNKIVTKVNWLSSNDYTSAEKNKVANIPNDTNADLATKASKLLATNLVTNGDFSNGTTGWTTEFGTAIVESGWLKLFSTSSIILSQAVTIPTSNKIYASFKSDVRRYVSGILGLQLRGPSTQTVNSPTTIGVYNVSQILTTVSQINSIAIANHTSSNADVLYDDILILNLTSIFGAGNEPTKEQMDWIFTERDRLALGHLNGTAELLPMVSLLNLINKKANIAQEEWITPTLLNGATAGTSTPQYYKTSTGVVRFRGNVKVLNNALPFMAMPVGYRLPVLTTVFSAWQFTINNFTRVVISDGVNLTAPNMTNGNIISLDQISYRAV